ncbi:MAG TPA: hypothetical protein VKB92_09655 [Myxococcales bacterium]|nr:hypothetical protein [Myxococcales bacterium]
MALLPARRPLELDPHALAQRRLRNFGVTAVLVAMGAAFCAGSVVSARQVVQERVLWSRGMQGKLVHLSGKVEETQKLGLTLFYDYDLDVKWLDSQGRQHSGKASFGRTFRAVGKREPPRLRYDPENPDHFVLSWAAQGGMPRAGVALLCGLLGGLMLLGARTLAKIERRRLELLQMCAEDGEEVVGEVEKAWSHKGIHYLRYRLPDDMRVRKYQGDAPFVFAREGALHVLALRSPRAPDAPFLVEADLRSFDLPIEVRARVLSAAGAG